MEREVLRQIPALEELHKALEAVGGAEVALADVVWEVVGGNPASYDQLRLRWVKAQLLGRKDVVKVAEDFLRDQLSTATEVLNDVLAAHPSLEEAVYARFKDIRVDALPASLRKQYAMPSPDKVLRFVKREGADKGVLKPATPAMALVLRFGVGGDPPSLEAVREALTARSSRAATVEASPNAPAPRRLE